MSATPRKCGFLRISCPKGASTWLTLQDCTFTVVADDGTEIDLVCVTKCDWHVENGNDVTSATITLVNVRTT